MLRSGKSPNGARTQWDLQCHFTLVSPTVGESDRDDIEKQGGNPHVGENKNNDVLVQPMGFSYSERYFLS